MSDTNPDLDLTFLYEIADGSDEFIVESVRIFLEQSPLILQQLSDGINTGDWKAAASAAHSIKGNLGFFSMLNSQALLIEIEDACKAGGPNPNGIKSKFDVLDEMLNQSYVKLREIKADKEANL